MGPMYKNPLAGRSIVYYRIYPGGLVSTPNGRIFTRRIALWIGYPRLMGDTRRAEQGYLQGRVSYGLDIRF